MYKQYEFVYAICYSEKRADCPQIKKMITVGRNIITEFTEKKSVFIGQTFYVSTEKEAEEAILASEEDISCTVYNAAHHGSSTSNTYAFLAAAAPEYAAVSCGLNNDYGHPHREVVSSFKELGVKYFRTDYDGDIIFGSDGENIYITTSK